MIEIAVFSPPAVDEKEILRYASSGAEDLSAKTLIRECMDEIGNLLSYRVCFSRLPIEKYESGISFAGVKSDSKSLLMSLKDCDELLLFAATIGVEIDRAVAHYGRISPAKALLFQAIGTERIESLCNAFCTQYQQKLKTENKYLKPRVSPGYGDISLTMQREIFSALDCPRKIGLTLNDSLMMTPTKSVTAIAGITRCKSNGKKICENCKKENCTFRREEESL